MKEKDKKTVFIIVRETQNNKDKLWQNAVDEGFRELSDYVRSVWRRLI